MILIEAEGRYISHCEQLEFCSNRQELQNINSKTNLEAAGPAKIEIKDRVFLILKVRELFWLEISLEVKEKWCQPTHSPLPWNPSWLKVWVHT